MAQLSLESAKDLYERRQTDFRELQEEARFIIDRALKQADVSIHTIGGRIKEWASLAKKLEGRQEVSDLFAEIHDIVGLRIVCIVFSDVERIGNLIRESFEVISEDDKITGQDVGTFGYLSLHLDVRLKGSHSGPRYDSIKDLIFEVQIRTIAMDAWASASHYLDYKTEADVPRDLRRDFYALSGLFYVADRHFEMFFRSRRITQKRIAKEVESASGMSEQEINLDSLTAYFRKKFPDRRHYDAASVSELITELTETGYRTVGQVDAAVDRGWDAFLAYERDHPPGQEGKPGTRFADIGVIRMLLGLVDKQFRLRRPLLYPPGPYLAMVKPQ